MSNKFLLKQKLFKLALAVYYISEYGINNILHYFIQKKRVTLNIGLDIIFQKEIWSTS